MYRILVVDDERYIADSAAALLSELGDENVEIVTAYLPKRALAVSAEKKIDVLVTDIEMPGMSGFELAEEVCGRWRACRAIMLTAYDSFAYSQQAIRARISDYILKLESNARILEAVRRVLDEIEEERAGELALQEERQRAERASSKLKQKLYFDYILNLRADDPARAAVGFSECLLAAVNVRRRGTCDSGEFLENVMDTEDLFRNAFGRFAEVISTVTSGTRILLLLLPTEESPDLTVTGEYVRDSLDGLAAEARSRFGVSLSIVCLKNPLRFSELRQAVKYASDLVGDRYAIENDLILQTDSAKKDLFFRAAEREELVGESDLFLLGVCLGNEQFDEFLAHAGRVFERLEGAPAGEVARADFLFLRLFCEYVTEKELLRRFKPQMFKNCFDFIMKCETAGELAGEVRGLVDLIRCKNERDDQNDYNRLLVENVNRYIAEHLDGDLSLTAIADRFCFNPSYFSRMYKRLSRVSLSEYIWSVKLEKAKEYLLNETLSVKRISEKLGFESNTYFTKFFKKQTGKTPVEFRRNHFIDRRELWEREE